MWDDTYEMKDSLIPQTSIKFLLCAEGKASGNTHCITLRQTCTILFE